MLVAALAGGMGWGIRGQYGHETGAMIPGLLVSLALVLACCPRAALLPVSRAAAWMTCAIGFGGSMTYGQTIGLTQDAALVGNHAALRWGLLGLALKGGVWIGFAGVFLGMGLGGIRYRARELLLVMLALIAAFAVGVRLLNSPFDPSGRVLPAIYFSADWRWQPDAVLAPRREIWGGLLAAFAALVAYARFARGDRMALRMGLWGVIGGATGFPLGQSLQAFHAWHPELFRDGLWVRLDPVMNWWTFMETTFGAAMGAALGLGLWLNRARIAAMPAAGEVTIAPGREWLLAAVHGMLLAVSEFSDVPVAALYTEIGLLLGIIPIAATAGGRWWPALLLLPLTLLPIAGKTVRALVYAQPVVPAAVGWLACFVLPLGLTLALAAWGARRMSASPSGAFTGAALLLSTWLYVALNFAFFRFPWPWAAWTPRTPNAIVFFLCAAGLTAAVAAARSRAAAPRAAC